MKNLMILATLSLAISPSLALGMEPAKRVPQNASNGARQNTQQYHDRTYHDRTPVAHDRSTVSPR